MLSLLPTVIVGLLVLQNCRFINGQNEVAVTSQCVPTEAMLVAPVCQEAVMDTLAVYSIRSIQHIAALSCCSRFGLNHCLTAAFRAGNCTGSEESMIRAVSNIRNVANSVFGSVRNDDCPSHEVLGIRYGLCHGMLGFFNAAIRYIQDGETYPVFENMTKAEAEAFLNEQPRDSVFSSLEGYEPEDLINELKHLRERFPEADDSVSAAVNENNTASDRGSRCLNLTEFDDAWNAIWRNYQENIANATRDYIRSFNQTFPFPGFNLTRVTNDFTNSFNSSMTNTTESFANLFGSLMGSINESSNGSLSPSFSMVPGFNVSTFDLLIDLNSTLSNLNDTLNDSASTRSNGSRSLDEELEGLGKLGSDAEEDLNGLNDNETEDTSSPVEDSRINASRKLKDLLERINDEAKDDIHESVHKIKGFLGKIRNVTESDKQKAKHDLHALFNKTKVFWKEVATAVREENSTVRGARCLFNVTFFNQGWEEFLRTIRKDSSEPTATSLSDIMDLDNNTLFSNNTRFNASRSLDWDTTDTDAMTCEELRENFNILLLLYALEVDLLDNSDDDDGKLKLILDEINQAENRSNFTIGSSSLLDDVSSKMVELRNDTVDSHSKIDEIVPDRDARQLMNQTWADFITNFNATVSNFGTFLAKTNPANDSLLIEVWTTTRSRNGSRNLNDEENLDEPISATNETVCADMEERLKDFLINSTNSTSFNDTELDAATEPVFSLEDLFNSNNTAPTIPVFELNVHENLTSLLEFQNESSLFPTTFTNVSGASLESGEIDALFSLNSTSLNETVRDLNASAFTRPIANDSEELGPSLFEVLVALSDLEYNRSDTKDLISNLDEILEANSTDIPLLHSFVMESNANNVSSLNGSFIQDASMLSTTPAPNGTPLPSISASPDQISLSELPTPGQANPTTLASTLEFINEVTSPGSSETLSETTLTTMDAENNFMVETGTKNSTQESSFEDRGRSMNLTITDEKRTNESTPTVKNNRDSRQFFPGRFPGTFPLVPATFPPATFPPTTSTSPPKVTTQASTTTQSTNIKSWTDKNFNPNESDLLNAIRILKSFSIEAAPSFVLINTFISLVLLRNLVNII